MENHEKYMRDALREAMCAAAEDEVPIGAVIVCKGRVIAKGHNMTERLNDPTAHAEMIAITAATEALGGKYLNDCARMSRWNLARCAPEPLHGPRSAKSSTELQIPSADSRSSVRH